MQHNHVSHHRHGHKPSSSSASKPTEREPHPTLNELEAIVNLPRNQWLPKLRNLKWKGNERINIEKWKNILEKLKEPINSIDTNYNHSSSEISLIYAILNIYVTLITHSSRHTMHNFDILSIDSLQKMIDLDDINILIIVLDVWNVFWHRSGGTMQFEHQDLKKKIVGLCHNILQNEFTLPIPENLQHLSKMSSLSAPIHKSYRSQWTQFAQTIRIPKEYCTRTHTQIIKQLKFNNNNIFNDDNELRKAINTELASLKQQISLSSEKEFVLKWRMYFAAQCNNLSARQNFIRLRIKALLVLSTFAQQYSSILRDFLSDIDFAELSLELTELVELTTIPLHYTTPNSPSPPNHHHHPHRHPSSPSSTSLSPRSPIPFSPKSGNNNNTIPNDIRISGLLCLKNFVFQVPIPFEQLRSIWDENSFVPATLRSIINDLDHEPESLSTLKFATQFLNFLHSTITRTLPQMVGIHQFLDWNSMVQQVLTLISNRNIRDCAVLKECATLLYVILAKQRKPQTFIQFKGLQLCFELIYRIMDNPKYLTNAIAQRYQDMKCMDVVKSSFSYHMIQQYTQQHLISKLLESCMQSVRLSRQPIQYLRDPLVAKIMNQLISKCYNRPKQVFMPSQFTPKVSNVRSNPPDEDNDTTMTENTNTEIEHKHVDEGTNDKIRPFAVISDSSTPPPASKRQKNKVSVPQLVLPIVPIPTDNYGHEVYQITCKMISVCIQNGAGLGVGKIFHEYGVTSTFVTSLTKGVPNRSQVFQIVVECLRAICLYQPALDMIMESGVIECLIRCFANPNYTSQLTAEAAGFFAKKMEELLRHNRKLQPYGIKAIVRTLKQLRNKPYLELKEMYSSPIYFQDNADINRDDIFPFEDDEQMQLIRNPTKAKTDKKDIYPLFPSNEKIKKRVIYPKEPCFTGDNEAFWSAVTNIGKFLETSLKKFTQWEFVKNGGMDALVQLSYDPIMHSVAAMKTRVFKAEKDKKDNKSEEKVDSDEKKPAIKMKDVTAEISAKFGSLVVPATNPKMTTAQKAVANSYPHIEDTEWPNLINKLLDTFCVADISDEFVKRFHYYTLEEVNGDLKQLKIKHQELADALKTGSRITCLFSILTRLMRRADIKIIHKSKFYLFMKCLSDIIPGILWYMSCSDTNSVHEQASKLRREVLGLLSNDEKKEKEKGKDADKTQKNNDEEVPDDNDDDVDMTQTQTQNDKIVQDQFNGVFINIRYYECQVVSLMNHFTKFFKNALRIYRRSQDGRQRNQFLVQNNQNAVEYMSHMLHILIAFRAPLLGKSHEAVFDFWSITQFYEYVCHIIEAMAFTSHKTIVEGLIKSFIQYGGLQRIVKIFRYFVHCLNLTLHSSWNNNTNDGKAYILSLDAENPSNPLNSIIHGAKYLFIKSDHSDDEDIKIRFCTESLAQKKKKNVKEVDSEQEKRKKEAEAKSKYGMNGVVENLKSVVLQFYNFLYSLMKAGNVSEVHPDFRRYLAVELAALLKSSWITQRDVDQYFKPTDFALIDKIVDSTNEYITICTAYNLEYPPPDIKEEKEEEKEVEDDTKSSKEEEEKKEMDVDIDEDDDDECDENKNDTDEKVVAPARQNAIDQLLSIVPDDRELVVYALDALQESAPNNVSVALEWIFTHQEAWKKKKETEAQQEKEATINDDDEIKYYFKSIDKKEFNAAITTAFYDEKENKNVDETSLVYLKSDKNTFNAPIYWEYYPLFTDITNELIAPLIGLIDKMPCEDQEKWTFRPMSQPDQVEKLLKRIALLIKAAHKSIGDITMKCLNKKQIWQEQQQASYKEMKKRKVAELIDAQEMRKAALLSKRLAKKEAAERKKKEAELAELEKNKPKEIVDNASDESYDEDEELRLAMQMSMMEQSDEANEEQEAEHKTEAEAETEIVPVPIDDGAPPVIEESEAKMQVDNKDTAAEEEEEEDEDDEEEEFETEYFDEDDVSETEEMRKLLVFATPPMYKQDQTAILLYSIKTLLRMFNSPRYPNNHAAAYCFAILQDAEPRTIFIAQENGLLRTICELIEECCKNLSELRAKYVDRDLEEKTYNECKTQIKKYQSLATTYYIIITGFLNKKAIRTLKENLLEDINRTHPYLYKNVTTQIAALDKESAATKQKEITDKESAKKEIKKKISFDEDVDDDDDDAVESKEKTDDKTPDNKDDGDVTMGMIQETETETEAEPVKKSQYQIKKERQKVKKALAKLDSDNEKKAEDDKHKQEFDILYGYIHKKCDKIKLEAAHKNDLLSSCLKLLNLFTWKPYFNSSNHSLKPKYYLRFQCEPNLLNRILAILESITSEYKYAKMLLNGEGYKCILNCSTTSSSSANTRISGMATSIIRHIFDEPSLLTDAMIRQIKLSFEHLRKTFTGKQKSASSPFANLSGNATPETAVFTQLFDPFIPLTNFMSSFKSLAARNESSFYNAVKNSCLIVRDEKSKLILSSRELLNKFALTLRQEAKQNGKWESQDPRTVQWMSYTDTDCIRIESVYQEFVNRFIGGNLQNFHSIPSTVSVHFDGQAFTVDVREYKQKNNSGGSRKIRRRRLNLEEKRKNALQAKKEKEEREKLVKEKQEKEKAETAKPCDGNEADKEKPEQNADDKLDENTNQKKSEKEEADDDEDGDVAIADKEKDKKISSPRSPIKLAYKVFNKYPMCRPYLEQHKTDDNVLSSFEAPLNALMSIIVQTTVDIKDYCIIKRVEMKNDERERRLKKKKESEQKEQKEKEKEKEKENNIVVGDDIDIDADVLDEDMAILTNKKGKTTDTADNELKMEEDDDELEDALPSISAMQTILGSCRLFAIGDMLKILNDIIGNYPKFSSLVVNFNANTGTLRSTSFVQFMIDELIPYSSPLNESKNVVKPDKSTIACNLLKSIAGLNQDKNQLSDQNATKFVLSTLVKHIGNHSSKLYRLSTWTELEKQPSLAGTKWNPMERMNKKLVKKHENKILEQLYQVKSNLEVLRDFVKTPSDRFCRFAARILTDSEVIDTVCKVLESKFDYGYCKTEVTNNRIIGNSLARSVELKSNFLNPIAKLLHNICEIDSINPIYNQLKSQRRKSRKRKSMDNNLMDVDNKSIDNTAPTSPLLESDPMINDGIIHSTSDERARAANPSSDLVQFISDISGQMGDIENVQFEVEHVVIDGDGHIEDRNYGVIDFDDGGNDDEDMVDSQDMNDESNANTELNDGDNEEDDDEDDDENENDEQDEEDDDDEDEDDDDEEDEDEEDDEQYNEENLDRLYGQYAEDDADAFYDDDDLNEYHEYGEEDIDEDDDDDDDEVDVPTSVHRIANDFMDDLGGSDDFRQFFLRSQRFANIRRLDSILNGDESAAIPRHVNRAGGQPQIHFVSQGPRTGNITSTSVFQIPPFDAQSLININNTSSAIPTMQPMLQMVQQHNALLQQSGITGPSSGNIAVRYPPPPMNVHIPHDLQQRYRLHHANRHGLHRVGADVPQSSSTLFQRAFGDSPEARRPRSLMAIYRLIDRPATSYFNSTDVQNELYNSTNNTASRTVQQQQRRSNANAQTDIMNHFNRIQRFYDAPHRRIGGNATNNDANLYRNEQTILAQNLMRDYVNGNWVGINQSQMTAQNLNALQEQFTALAPDIAPDSNGNVAVDVENKEDIVVAANAVLDDTTLVPSYDCFANENNEDAEPAAISNVVANNNDSQSPAVNNITDQVSNLLRSIPGFNNAENNNSGNNANSAAAVAAPLDALTSQIFGMINRNSNNNDNNASLLEVIAAPANNDDDDAVLAALPPDIPQETLSEQENKQSMDVDQEESLILAPPEDVYVQASTSDNKENVEASEQTQTTVEADESKEAKAPEQKQEASANAMDVDPTVAVAADDNNANADDVVGSAQALLTRLEREIENNPIWNYSEMLNFDPDVILSLPEVIRNDIIPPEFQNEVGTYLSMYQAQIAQRYIQRRRVNQQQQPQQAPAQPPAAAVSDSNADNTDNANTEHKENKENVDANDTADVVMDDNTNNDNGNAEDNTLILAPPPVSQPEYKQQAAATMDVDTNVNSNTVPTANNDIPQTLPTLNNSANANNPATADAAFAAALAAAQNNAANTNNNAANTNNTNAAPRRNVIDPSVLAALPPDIQQEILREQQRNTVMEMTQNNEMDHATALLTVDPQTRMEMLMELSDDASLQQLPSHLLAEAIMLRNRRGYGMGGRWGFRRGGRGRGRGAYGMGDIDSHTNSQPLSAWDIAARERYNNNNSNNNNQSEEKKEEKKEANVNKDAPEKKEKDKDKDKDEEKKKRKKRSPEENRQIVVRKLCKESAPSIRNRIISQYKPPINILSLNSLLKIMETSEVGHSELVLRGIFARLCKYQRLRVIIFNSLFDQLTFASPRYTSIQETALNNNENRARLRRSLALIRYLMQSSTTAGYLVKYMQLPTDFEMFVQGASPKKAKVVRDNTDVDMKDNSNSVVIDSNFDMTKCRILTLFSLFGSPMLKNQSILQSFVETLSMLCKSNEMYLSHLQISIDPQDIKHLVSLISDHIRCNDSIFTKLNNVAKSIMNVPSNKRSLTSQIIAESHNLSTQISKELNTIYKIISPSKHSSKRLMKSWTITTKQNALLRNIEFLNKLISSTACRKFNVAKEMSKIKLLHADANQAEIEEFLKEKKELHSEQLLLLTECSKGMEQLWIALDRCLEVFGYVPKEILLKQIKNKEKEKKEKEKKEKKEEKENEKKEVDRPELEMENKSSQKPGTHFTNEEEAMKAKMNQQHAILKKQTNKEEDARITSSVERLKPLIRAFFILHDFYSVDEFLKEKTPEQLHNDLIADGGENSIASTYLVSRYEYFLQFTDVHRNIFNLLIAHKPKLLISDIKNDNIYPFPRTQNVSNKYGAFAALVWHPKRVLDFDNKKMFLRDELKKLKEKLLLSRRGFDGGVGRVRICVRRKQLFADAFAQIKQWTRRELMSRLSVKFLGEDGVDAGGLTREFYQAMSYEMFNPNYSLFIPTNDNKSVFQPNLNSGYANQSHLEDFKFVGLMCAKAIYDEQVLDAYFTRSFLKHVLGIKPNWHDLQSLDFQHYKNLKWMLEHTIDNVIFETFTYNVNTYGVKKEYVLKKDGDGIDVNDQNKKEYIKLIADFKMTKQISQQIKAFCEGLHILIPHWLISIFTWPELDLLICGLPDIDIKDMAQNTEYHGGLTKNTKQIKWFWQCVQEMDKEERALLLQFITGTSKVPIGGFKALPGMDGIQRLQIHSCGQMNSQNTDNLLPSAHTCFNQLDLPKYSTKIILKSKIMLAIRECSQGFGFS